MLSVRVVTVDYYLSRPVKQLSNQINFGKHWIEPVIRIFGPTSEGIKTCVNIHGVYPYIYVPYRGGESPDRDALLLGAALDQALAVNSNAKNPRFVYKVILTSGIPIYGYHSRPRQFFKIYFYNPHHVRKASDLLLSGAILGQRFQPHEAHIPFTLQFMIDYNIYGMSYINLEKVKYRRSPRNPESLKGIERRHILPVYVKRNTYSFWEVDACAEDILNCRSSRGTVSVNPGLQAIWEDEKSRRRAQNRVSQITPQTSQSRPEPKLTSNELMHKQRLAQRLRDVVFEVGDATPESGASLSYPAELPENATDILEASVVGAEAASQPSGDVPENVSDLIDEEILKRVLDEEGDEEEVVKIEDDSILGRNQREEEEAEPDEDDGGDMTQPLEPLEIPKSEIGDECIANRDERGGKKHDCEDEFWEKMADRIMQLDGADDPSSLDSDEDRRSMAATHCDPQFLAKADDAVERILGGTQPNDESMSNWSSSIMSILNENTAYQTPQTLWSNWSPKEPLWPALNNQDSWNWDKNDSTLLDCLSYSVKKTGKDVTYQHGETVPSGDLYGFAPAPGEYFHGNYTPTSTMSPMGSVYNISPPSAILTPSSEMDSYSDVNLDSASQVSSSPSPLEDARAIEFKAQVIESKTVTVPRMDAKKPDLPPNHKDLVELLQKLSESRRNPDQADTRVRTVALTLRQYIKGCGEIVSVDFKTLSGKEMIVVEYKSVNSKSNQNKYLIKPLEKFLEDWNSTEGKLNNVPAEGGRTEWPRLINGFDNTKEDEKQLNAILNTLENKYTGNWLDQSKIKSIKNKFVVKTMEMLPENGETTVGGKIIKGDAEKSYKVNENVISDGKIKMRLIKDGKMKKEEESLLGSEITRANGSKKKSKLGKESEQVEKVGSGRDVEKLRAEGEDSEDLIEQINQSFEDYFKSIVKVNSCSSKNEKPVKEEEWTSGEESESDSEKTSSEAIRFITQLLSALTSLPQSVPPLSITINVGNGRISPSVQFNLQSGGQQRRRRTKKLTVSNFDGAADTSSSEDSLGEGQPATARTPTKKKQTKDSGYKPLNVVLQKTPASAFADRKRKLTKNLSEEFEGDSPSGVSCVVDRPGKRSDSASRTFAREEGRRRRTSGGAGAEQEVQTQDLTRFREGSRSYQQLSQFSQAVRSVAEVIETDFIGDSEEEVEEIGGRRRKKRRLRRILRKAKKLKMEEVNVPQTDVVSSSDGESSRSEGRPQSEDKNIFSFHDAAMVSITEVSDVQPEMDEMPKDDFQALSQTPSRSHPSSEGNYTPLSKTLFDISSVLEKTNLEEVAVNSDDSLRKEEVFEREREVTPFDLSGSILHGESVQTTPRLFVVTPTEAASPLVRSVSTDERPREILTVSGSTTVAPKKKPPSFREVQITSKDFGIEEMIGQVPFYSDARDISRCEQVGERILKIENYSVAGLIAHSSEVGLHGTEERRNRALNQLKKGIKSVRAFLVGTREVYITPLGRPPTRLEVSKRLQEDGDKKVKEDERKRAKVRMPRSPGQDSGSDDEIDVSVTLTPPSRRSSAEESVFHTPKPGPSGLRRISSDDSSLSACSFPEDLKHSTPRVSNSPNPLGLRKGPLHRIKGVKRISLMKKLETIAEEQQILSEKSEEQETRKTASDTSFGFRGVTLDNTYGFKTSVECLQNVRAAQDHENITVMVGEVHVQTRGDLRPDPEFDPICAFFYTVVTDSPDGRRQTGMIAVGESVLAGTASPRIVVHLVPDEESLLEKMTELLREFDPDILAGYEIEMLSWGYLFQRGFALEKNLFSTAGRVVDEKWNEQGNVGGGSDFEDLPRYIRHMRITGRIVLDVWRILRHEATLTSYTFENVMYHILHERLPKHTFRDLALFWQHPTRLWRHITVEYFVARTEGVVRLLEHLDFIGRNSELARLFGIQFYEVLSRGSQFRVESMMLRLAKPQNYVACSPSIRQRANMRAPASLPLIMEPESKFYCDPIIVLDFQSLYPSMIIAYNYCFSTCLGRVEMLGGKEPFEFGCTQLQVSPEELKMLEKDINISPAGIAFVRANVRKGVLPSMLEEILDTRLMVKKSMKENKGNRGLQKVLHARQLGLKLIANVTYGYTAANFSGRMPCIEVGDSVVSKGRETLQRAIEMVKKTPEWGARVVYGDTDSMFVLTPGKTKEEAFCIGAEIADAVTRDNPKPVKLKLEKVYQPSILQTKKRYVGYMYETPDQEKPLYEAKGIETVRRDGCPATAKILQKALQILFETRDVTQVKRYTIRQFGKLFQTRVNTQDLIFAKEYRGRRGYRPGACVPALELAKRWTQTDRRAEPRVKERVPYVIVNGPPGLPLIRLVRSPKDLFVDDTLRINAVYYITKAIIPPMQRCFSLLGADVASWYAEMPRRYHKMIKSTWKPEGQRGSTISQYFSAVECVMCSEVSWTPVCGKCQENEQKIAVVIHEKIRRLERSDDGIAKICGSCCGRVNWITCESLDCPVLYRRHQVSRDARQVTALRNICFTYLQ